MAIAYFLHIRPDGWFQASERKLYRVKRQGEHGLEPADSEGKAKGREVASLLLSTSFLASR
jgi:hypothetical protein